MRTRPENFDQMMIDNDQDIVREKKAIQKFVSRFDGSFKKLAPNDIDYRVFDKDNNLIAYAEVTPVYSPISQSYPLPISAKKVVKVCDKMLNPVMIWACDDGIVYAKPSEVKGEAIWQDNQVVILYHKQQGTKYIKY